jgi:hypothetical protein
MKVSLGAEAEQMVEALKAGDKSKLTEAFLSAVGKIDAAPARAVDSVEAFWDALHAAGAPEDWIGDIAEDLGVEVSPEVRRVLAAAWQPKL